MNRLGVIDWSVCIAYLTVVFGLAVWSMRGQRDNEDYFVGGRKMNWFAVGISMFATSYTAVGGLRAVIWTDVLQAVTLGGAVVVVPLLAVSGIGGGWSGLSTPTWTFLTRWVAEGPTHHFALGVGHHARSIRDIAQILGIESVIVLENA